VSLFQLLVFVLWFFCINSAIPFVHIFLLAIVRVSIVNKKQYKKREGGGGNCACTQAPTLLSVRKQVYSWWSSWIIFVVLYRSRGICFFFGTVDSRKRGRRNGLGNPLLASYVLLF
jgi:hypothetical protein